MKDLFLEILVGRLPGSAAKNAYIEGFDILVSYYINHISTLIFI